MSKLSLRESKKSYDGTLAALQPLKKQLQQKLDNLNQVVIKINFVTTKKELATTPVDAVRAFVDFILPFYSGRIVIAEEASMGSTVEGFKRHGFNALADGCDQVELFDSGTGDVDAATLNYPHGELKLPLSQIYTRSPFVASITRAKTHNSVVVTLAIKNLLVGAIQGGMGSRGKIHQGRDIHWILKELSEFVYPDLAIIDGTVGMQGSGPGSGDPINSNWVLSSLDALAADSLAAYLMGFNIDDVGYLNLIRETDKGSLYPKDEIKIDGPILDNLKTKYQPHPTFNRQRDWRLD